MIEKAANFMNLILYNKSISYEILDQYNPLKECLIMSMWLAKKIIFLERYKEVKSLVSKILIHKENKYFDFLNKTSDLRKVFIYIFQPFYSI